MGSGIEDRLHAVQELFAVMTVFSEDAAGIALDGQGCTDPVEIVQLADKLRDTAQRLIDVANAVRAIPLG